MTDISYNSYYHLPIAYPQQEYHHPSSSSSAPPRQACGAEERTRGSEPREASSAIHQPLLSLCGSHPPLTAAVLSSAASFHPLMTKALHARCEKFTKYREA